MNTTCNHTDEIAKVIFVQHHNQLHPGTPTDWSALPEEEKQAWRKVAGNILPTLGEHALNDLLAYARRKLKESSSTWRRILWGLAAAALLAALSWLASLGLTGCGHAVDITQDGAAICKDGACLVIKDGHIYYTPAQKAVSPAFVSVPTDAPVRQEK